MNKAIKPKLANLREIIKRQDPPQWGAAYDPAIRATREEAPSRSRASKIWSEKLGRYCHALSSVEQKAILLALFNPALFELQEQRILSTEPRPHPLASHPWVVGESLPELRGTIEVCDRLGMLQRHQWIYVNHPSKEERVPIPIPFVGDLLLFLTDARGPYCVNWTVKHSEEGFEQPLFLNRPVKNPGKAIQSTGERHAIEECYYLDAAIQTIRVVNRQIPDEFAFNLMTLFLLQHRAKDIPLAIYQEACDRLQACLHTGQPPLELSLSLIHRYNLSPDLAKALLFRAIWRRDVRPELFDEAIFIDRPLKPEKRDPLKVFAAWFARKEG